MMFFKRGHFSLLFFLDDLAYCGRAKGNGGNHLHLFNQLMLHMEQNTNDKVSGATEDIAIILMFHYSNGFFVQFNCLLMTNSFVMQLQCRCRFSWFLNGRIYGFMMTLRMDDACDADVV